MGGRRGQPGGADVGFASAGERFRNLSAATPSQRAGAWGNPGLAKGARPRIGRRQRAFEAEVRKVYFAMRLVVCAICRVLVPVSSLALPDSSLALPDSSLTLPVSTKVR